MHKTIYIRTSFVGFHLWKDAPNEVGFLRNLHRHIFNVKVAVEVSHSDRDVEFFMMKKDVNFVISRFDTPFSDDGVFLDWKMVGSCEMVAEKIIQDLWLMNYKVISVEVDEDGENGSIIFNTNEY